jgi:hypothetical protein
MLTLAGLKEKRPFRRNGLTSNDCLPYENLRIISFGAESSAGLQVRHLIYDL